MKKSSEKSLIASSEQVIYSDGCRVERSRRRRDDRSGSVKFRDNDKEIEEIVLYHGDFETVEENPAKKINTPYIILSLTAIFSLVLGGYTLMQVSTTSSNSITEISDSITATIPSIASPTVDNNISKAVAEVNAYNLEQLANRLITKREWNDLSLNVFREKLLKLDELTYADIAGTKWFQNVSFLVKNEITQQNLSINGNILAGESPQALLQLAVIMGISVPEYDSDRYLTEAASIEKILAEAEIAALEAENAQPLTEEPETRLTEVDINNVLDRYIAAYKVGNTDKVLELYLFDGVTELQIIGKLKRHLEKLFKNSSDRKINFSDLDWQIEGDKAVGNGKYKAKIALKHGRGTQTINAKTQIKLQLLQGKLLLADLKLIDAKVDVVKLKKPSKKTKVAKHKKHQSKQATKKSKTKSSSAKLAENMPVLQKTKAVAKQTIPVLVVAASSKKSSGSEIVPVFADTSAKSQSRSSKFPTKQELKIVVEKFVKAYDEGDIKALGSLFTENAKTNDQNNLSEIRQDYIDFFSKTTNRQIYIKALNWTINDNLARGVGKLRVVVVSTTNSKAQIVNGTIQIKAKKVNNKVLITHLFHKEGTDLGMSASNN